MAIQDYIYSFPLLVMAFSTYESTYVRVLVNGIEGLNMYPDIAWHKQLPRSIWYIAKYGAKY